MLPILVDLFIWIKSELAELVLGGWGRSIAAKEALSDSEYEADDPKVEYALSIHLVGSVSRNCGYTVDRGEAAASHAKRCELTHRIEAEDSADNQSDNEVAAAERLAHEANKARREQEDTECEQNSLHEHRHVGTVLEYIQKLPRVAAINAPVLALQE